MHFGSLKICDECAELTFTRLFIALCGTGENGVKKRGLKVLRGRPSNEFYVERPVGE